MQKFLKYFIGTCAVIIGVYSMVQGIQQIMSTRSPEKKELMGYAEKIDPIAKESAQILNKISPLFNDPGQSTNLLTEVTTAKNQFITLEQQARAVQPPKNLGNLHQEFVDSMGLYRRAFLLTEEGLQQNDLSKTEKAADLLVKGSNQLQHVSQELVKLSKR